MAERVEPGHYRLGRQQDTSKLGPCSQGEWGVIKGENANENGHIEWKMHNGVRENNWYVYRVGPLEEGSRRPCTVAHIEKKVDSKGDGVGYVERKCSGEFDKTY
jgi:hypothetical protein